MFQICQSFILYQIISCHIVDNGTIGYTINNLKQSFVFVVYINNLSRRIGFFDVIRAGIPFYAGYFHGINLSFAYLGGIIRPGNQT
ncbi:MAG: hypothetical protein BWX77_00997 [Bacteroidetes bacterium ADurb.Bin090]|nr:MAG: hypothetical protein BWX77_00997 [Bacteroidetes bacterium ADurb.Bin090]